MTAGRKPAGIVPQEKPVVDAEPVMERIALAVRAEIEAKENVRTLARELAYEGALTVGGLEEEIKFFQRRSVEAVLELGKRLLLLKEVAGHGEFAERLDGLGFNPRLAQQFMGATLKFSNTKSTSLLALPNLSQTKLLELLVLDEGEIEALDQGDTVRGLKLDDVDCMSVSELRRALRESKARIEAKDRVAADNQAAMQRLQEQVAGRKPAPTQEPPAPAFLADSALRDLDNEVLTVVARIEASLRSYLVKVAAPELEIGDILRRQAISGAMGRVLAAARQVAQDFGVAVSGLDAADGCGEDDAIWAATLAEFDAGQEALSAPAGECEGGDDGTEG